MSGEWLPLKNLDTESDFWELGPFWHLIRVMSRQKDERRKKDKDKKDSIILWSQDSFALLQCFPCCHIICAISPSNYSPWGSWRSSYQIFGLTNICRGRGCWRRWYRWFHLYQIFGLTNIWPTKYLQIIGLTNISRERGDAGEGDIADFISIRNWACATKRGFRNLVSNTAVQRTYLQNEERVMMRNTTITF